MFAYALQKAADIVIGDANLVLVGHDQRSHVELTRTIAGASRPLQRGRPYFPDPEALLADAPLILGSAAGI